MNNAGSTLARLVRRDPSMRSSTTPNTSTVSMSSRRKMKSAAIGIASRLFAETRPTLAIAKITHDLEVQERAPDGFHRLRGERSAAHSAQRFRVAKRLQIGCGAKIGRGAEGKIVGIGLDAEEHRRGHGRIVIAFGAEGREAALRVLGINRTSRPDVVTNVDERRFRHRRRTVVIDDRE